MNERKANRTHQRIVIECFVALKKAEEENDFDKEMRIMSRYGRKTLNDAVEMLKDYKAEKLGMTREEFDKWVESDK